MNTKILRLSNTSLSENKGKKRLYLQGKWMAQAGFNAGEKINACSRMGR